jgi:hypothetical protein
MLTTLVIPAFAFFNVNKFDEVEITGGAITPYALVLILSRLVSKTIAPSGTFSSSYWINVGISTENSIYLNCDYYLAFYKWVYTVLLYSSSSTKRDFSV